MFATFHNFIRDRGRIIISHDVKPGLFVNVTSCFPLALALLVTANLEIDMIDSIVEDCKVQNTLKQERA